VLINYPLYENFAWYRRSVAEQYAHVTGMGEPLLTLIEANRGERAIFFGPILVEQGRLSDLQYELEQVNQLWRY